MSNIEDTKGFYPNVTSINRRRICNSITNFRMYDYRMSLLTLADAIFSCTSTFCLIHENNSSWQKVSEINLLMSVFSQVEMGDPIEVFTVQQNFLDDPSENKVNLGIGALRDNNGEIYVLPPVRQAEKAIAADETLNKEYLSILGLESFITAAMKLLLGSNSQPLLEGRAFGVQVLSGTGGLRLAAEFLSRQLGYRTVYVSTPGWDNHRLIFTMAGFNEIRYYRYWKESTKAVDLEGMLTDLRNAVDHAVVIFHVCAHNPTGSDPTPSQWIQIADVVKGKRLFPVLDCAFQGMASGDVEKDAWSVRYFASNGFELFCSQSFSKTFGIYNERVGNLICIVKDSDAVRNIKSQLVSIVRGLYSNPPINGARIVTYILTDQQLHDEWKQCITQMGEKLMYLRRRLREALERLGTPGNWEHITRQIGLFSYIGLTEEQSLYLIKVHHIYMLRSGRMNLSGLTYSNVDYVAKAIHDAILNVPNKKQCES